MSVFLLAPSTTVISPATLTYSPDTLLQIQNAYLEADYSSITNQGTIVDVGAWTLALRYSTFINTGSMFVYGSMTVRALNQYGTPAVVTNNGLLWDVGGAVSLQAVAGTGEIRVTHGGTVQIGGAVSAGETVRLTAGMLEFGANRSLMTGATPGMQFMGTVTGLTDQSHLKLDGAFGGDPLAITWGLSVIAPGLTDFTVSDHGRQVLDAHLAGHYDVSEFKVTSSGSDLVVAFHAHPLGFLPHS